MMPEPTARGEFTIEAGGRSYRLRLSINALVRLEAMLGCGAIEAASRLAQRDTMRFGDVRSIFFASLTDAHPEVTLDDAGEIMSEIGLPHAVNLCVLMFNACVAAKGTPAPMPDHFNKSEAAGPLAPLTVAKAG